MSEEPIRTEASSPARRQVNAQSLLQQVQAAEEGLEARVGAQPECSLQLQSFAYLSSMKSRM